MTKQDYVNLVNKNPRTIGRTIKSLELYDDIKQFNTANGFENIPISQQAYNYFFNITEQPKCKLCGKKSVTFGGNKRFGYADYCSKQCVGKANKGKSLCVGHSPYNVVVDEEILLIDYEEIPDIKFQVKDALLCLDVANLKYSLFKKNPKLLRAIYELSDADSFVERLYQIINGLKEPPKCVVCGENFQNFYTLKRGYSGVCSRSCGAKLHNEKKRKLAQRKENFIIYDRETTVDKIQNYRKSIHKNNLTQSLHSIDSNLIYSVEFHTQYIKDRSFKEKFYHILNDLTELPRCVECGNENDQAFFTVEKGYRSDFCVSCSFKNGHEKSSKTHRIQKRSKNFNAYKEELEKTNEILNTYEDYIDTGVFVLRHLECGKIYERKYAYLNGCPHCAFQGTSKWEKEVRLFVESLGVKTVFNKKPLRLEEFKHSQGNIGKREIDIQIPDYNLGIECDGIYYHTELNGKDKNYHLEKTEQAKKQLNVDLIHILDSEWNQKQEIVKSMLLNRMGKITNKIYARKCEIREVSPKDKNDFLEHNHLQGKDLSSVKLGLYFEGELVSLMTFGKRRITNKTSFELIRFCNKINTSVIGAASKLFKHFLNNYWEGQEIVTYADKRWSQGNLYHVLGFDYSHDSSPNYWYTDNYYDLQHRANHMKHKLEDKLDQYDPKLTEWENMKNNGYDRFWDCGNMVFKYETRKTVKVNIDK